MMSFYNTLEGLGASIIPFPSFLEFINVSLISSLTYSPAISSIPLVGPHSHTKPTLQNTRPLTTRPLSIPKKLTKATSTQVVDLTDEEPQSHGSTPITR